MCRARGVLVTETLYCLSIYSVCTVNASLSWYLVIDGIAERLADYFPWFAI